MSKAALEALDRIADRFLTHPPAAMADIATIRAALKAKGAPERDSDWILAIGNALGLNSGFNVPIVPEVEPFRELFAAIRAKKPRPRHPGEGEIEPREALASRLIDAWCADNGKKIPWAKAVQIAAIVTGQSDHERDRLLRLGYEDGACGTCGRSDAALEAKGAPGEAVGWVYEIEDEEDYEFHFGPHCPSGWPAHACRPLYAAPPAAAPQGWKLVPVEPTREMEDAVMTAARFQLNRGITRSSMKAMHVAMLAAAPSPTGGEEE